MGISLKSIGRGIKKAASVANPLFGAAYDAIGGKSVKDIGKNYVQNNLDGAKVAALGATVAPAVGAAGAGTAAAGAAKAGMASKLGSFFGSPGGAALLDFGGNLLSGMAQGKESERNRNEERRQFDLTYGLQKGKDDRDAAMFGARQRGLAATTPLRQQLLSQVMARFGITPPPPQRTLPNRMLANIAPTVNGDLRERLMSMMGAG